LNQEGTVGIIRLGAVTLLLFLVFGIWEKMTKCSLAEKIDSRVSNYFAFLAYPIVIPVHRLIFLLPLYPAKPYFVIFSLIPNAKYQSRRKVPSDDTLSLHYKG